MRGFLKITGITLLVLLAGGLLYLAIVEKIEWLEWTIAGGVFLWIGTRALDDWENRKQRERELKRQEHLEVLMRLDRIAEILDRQNPKPRPEPDFGPFFTVPDRQA